MKIFTKIDDFLLDKLFQKFTWWFQVKTGKNNFWLGQICLIIINVMVMIITAPLLIEAGVPIYKITTLAVILFVLIVAGEFVKKQAAEYEKIFSEKTDKFVSSVRLTGIKIRIIFLILSIIMTVKDIWLISVKDERLLKLLPFFSSYIFLVCMLYFYSCTPLPPGRIRKRSKIKGKLAPAYEKQ